MKGGKRFSLTLNERRQIEAHIATDISLKEIACQIGRSASAINTEVRRNGGRDRYNAEKAHEGAIERNNARIEKARKQVRRFNLWETLINRIEALEFQVEILADTIKNMRSK